MFGLGGFAAGAAILGGTLPALDAVAQNIAPLPQVPRRVLGKTKKDIPILLMGGAMGFDARFDPRLAEAVRFGVNYIDAADCYAGGQCEPSVGAYHTRAKNRDKIWITTKSDRWEPEGLEATLRTSLERLKTDHVDMYYLHQLDEPSRLSSETARVAERMKKEGRILHFGFSCHSGNVVELMNLAAKTSWVDSIMFRYNFRQYGNRELNAAIDA